MAFWDTVLTWARMGGGSGSSRNVGDQTSGPSGYAVASVTPVTEDTALQLAAVWACVRLLAETVASLPVSVYKRTKDGPVIVDDHWLAKLMARKPNRYQTKVEFFETMMLNLVLHGNCYAKITKIGGEIRSMLPLMASQIDVKLLDDGSVVYTYTADGDVTVFASESIWHVKLYGNCIVGKSPLAFGRNMLGISQAAEDQTSRIYANGAKPSGVLSMDAILKPEQREQIRRSFSSMTEGTDSRLMILEAGVKFDAVSMSPQDIELLSSRKHQTDEICRWFGVPSIMVNQNEGTTTLGSSAAEIISTFYKLNLRPYLERFEASISCNLFTPEEAKEFYFEFDFEGLLRSDLKSRLEGYRTAIAGSILAPNECRRIEGWPEKEGGNDLLAQVAMIPLQKLGQQPAPKVPEEPANGA